MWESHGDDQLVAFDPAIKLLVFLLQPYAGNMRKRLTKAPKLYFYDTGLLCHLLGIQDERSLMNTP